MFQSISDQATLAVFLTQEKTQGGPVYKILCQGRAQAVTEGQSFAVSTVPSNKIMFLCILEHSWHTDKYRIQFPES